MSEVSLESLCRLCLTESFLHANIFIDQVPHSSVIYEALNFVYDLGVYVGDGLSANICRPCLWKLREFEIYKTNVHQAKDVLLSLKEKDGYREVEASCSIAHEEERVTFTAQDDQDFSQQDTIVKIEQESLEISDDDHSGIKTTGMVLRSSKSTDHSVSAKRRRQTDEEDEVPMGNVSENPKENNSYDEGSRNGEDTDGSFKYHSLRNTRSESKFGSSSKSFQVSSEDECETVDSSTRQSRQLRHSEISINDFESMELIKELSSRGANVEWTCKMCNYKVSNYTEAISHQETHDERTEYKCTRCSKKFVKKHLFTRHVREHVCQEECDVCHMRFRTVWHLERHLVTHSTSRKWKCDHCNKRFRSNGNMKRHKMTHTLEKPYSCDYCDYKAFRTAHIRRHLSTHKGEVLKCPYCPVTCGSPESILEHKREEHADELRKLRIKCTGIKIPIDRK